MPDTVSCAEFTTPTVLTPAAPATTPPALTVPVAVRCCELSVPAVVRPAAVTGPDDETLVATMGPAFMVDADRTATVAEPATDRLAELIRPVTDAVLDCRVPATETVRVGSLPRTMPAAEAPMRTTPLEAPVPASRTTSPPTLLACPLALAQQVTSAALVRGIGSAHQSEERITTH